MTRSKRLEREVALVAERLDRGDPSWPAQLTIAAVIALDLAMSERVTVGPNWLLPSIGGLLLAAFVAAAPAHATAHAPRVHRLALAVIAVVSLANLVSLGLLIHFLVDGGQTVGHRLILSGALLWASNVLLFAVWYWQLDRGGPVARFLNVDAQPDFQFTQMDDPQLAPPGWRPGFGDYLYLSLTNATAFSPTDTMPLTQTAKLTMGIQSIAAMLTIGLVVARAVNILG